MSSGTKNPTLAKLPQRWSRRLLVAAAGVLVLWLIGWLGVPPLLKWQLQKQGSAQLGRSVSVERVAFVPWSLALTIEGLRVAKAGGEGSQFTVERLYIDAELQSLLRLAPVIDAISVEEPRLSLHHQGGGRYDIDDILQRLTGPVSAESKGSPRFSVYNIRVTGGEITFFDEPRQLTHTLDKLTLGVPFLSNLPSRRDVATQPRLSFSLNGSAFDSDASSTPFADDRKTEASLNISAFDLAPYLPYWPVAWPVRPTTGVLDLSLKLAFEQRERPQVVLSGGAVLSKLRVEHARRGESPTELLAWDRLSVVVRRVEPLARQIALESVALQGPRLALSREPGGRTNLQALLDDWPAVLGKPGEGQAAAVAPAWTVELGTLTLADGAIAWNDASVAPAASLALSQLQFSARAIAWPVREAVPFEGAALLGTTPIRWQGNATDTQASAELTLADLPLSLAAPYLAQTLVPALNGRLTTELALRWQKPTAQRPMGLELSAARIELDDLTLGPARAPLASLKQLLMASVSVDLTARSAQLGEVFLDRPRVAVVREQDGRWMAQRWLKPSEPSPGMARPWAMGIAQVTVKDGDLGWEDRQPARPVALRLTGLQLDLKDLKPLAPRQALMPLNLQLRLVRAQAHQGDPARLDFRGALRLPGPDAVRDPGLSLRGKLQAERLPVHALEPYFGDRLNLELLRADASYRGSLNVNLAASGLALTLAGDAALEDFRANTRAPSEELLNWKSLNLRGLALDISPSRPLRLSVDETVLSDYFARVIVQTNGRLNLQGLVKENDTVALAGATSAAVSTAQPVAAAADRPDIRFGPIGLVDGRVFFSDRFIQPNYSANLSELTGGISAFASAVPGSGSEPALADLTLKGRAEGTAEIEISGQLNPLARPLALDIRGKVRDLELPPLSPYSAKYAGYGIERGKLSVDVAYRIDPKGQLSASNQIVLNQLVFGDRVAGSDAPNLPVKLAVALLADRDGVIDINLPVSGSINDPQFRLAPIIWRLVLNLVGKAITAPFSLIGSALGAGDELSRVDFAPGSSVLDQAGRQRLDAVAQALKDRPALQLTVIGQSDLALERVAYQRAQLQRALLAEKRRELARSGADIPAGLVVTPEEEPALLKAVYRRADVPKPRNAIGMARDLPAPEMEALLLAAQPVNADALRELAVARGMAVKGYLATRELPESRLFLGAPLLSAEGDAWRPQAELKLAPR